jgi:ribosomal-protein-alanine N-acetyltransferase
MIGTIELYNHAYHHKAELGYALNPHYWGLGIIPEAATEVINFGFNFLKLQRIEVGAFPDNTQSIRVCEKLGFKKEGIRRKGHQRYDGTFLDTIVYSLTDEDYRELYGEETNEDR